MDPWNDLCAVSQVDWMEWLLCEVKVENSGDETLDDCPIIQVQHSFPIPLPKCRDH